VRKKPPSSYIPLSRLERENNAKFHRTQKEPVQVPDVSFWLEGRFFSSI
jgi:hypothetical protein